MPRPADAASRTNPVNPRAAHAMKRGRLRKLIKPTVTEAWLVDGHVKGDRGRFTGLDFTCKVNTRAPCWQGSRKVDGDDLPGNSGPIGICRTGHITRTARPAERSHSGCNAVFNLEAATCQTLRNTCGA